MGRVKKRSQKVNRSSKVGRSRPLNGRTLRSAVTWALDGKVFASLKTHGNTTWQLIDLIVLAMLWVWSDDKTLGGAFVEANRLSISLLGRSVITTYQGLLKALVTWTEPVLPLIQERLHQLMEEHGGEHFRFRGWLPIAVDGSRVPFVFVQRHQQVRSAQPFENEQARIFPPLLGWPIGNVLVNPDQVDQDRL